METCLLQTQFKHVKLFPDGFLKKLKTFGASTSTVRSLKRFKCGARTFSAPSPPPCKIGLMKSNCHYIFDVSHRVSRYFRMMSSTFGSRD